MKALSAVVFSLALTMLSLLAAAAEIPFNQSQFDAAQAAGKPVAVVFHADWCPTCRAQAPVLKSLMQTTEFKPLTVFVANFDTAKDLKMALRVSKQSTIVVFKGGKEVDRSTGDTQSDSLAALLRHAVP